MALLTSELLDDFFAALRPRLAGTLRTDAMTRALYATDASLYQMMPVGVLLPRHADDVQAALEEARRFGVPVLPRGGGSSLAGQTVGEALVIDFTPHLDAVVELNAEERWVRVQPGLVLDRLDRYLRARAPHLMVGPDPASGKRATLGGMLGNNATGTHSILYGNMVRHVAAAQALLDDGTPVRLEPLPPDAWAERTRRAGREGQLYRDLDALLTAHRDVIERDTPRHWRRNSGYRLEYLLGDERNVAQLLCGSEGTLAVVTELTVRLVDRPRRTALGVVHFHTRREALRAVPTILGTDPSAVEFFDGRSIRQARRSPGFGHRLTFVEGEPGGVLITEYYGATEAELTGRLDELEDTLARAGKGYAVVRVTDPAAIANVWGVRTEALGLIMNVRGDHKPVAFIEDASVPPEHLADYIDALAKVLEETQTEAVMYAHASAGCLHVRPFINTKDAAEVAKMREIALASAELVRKYGGAVSSEHGDGLARSWLTPTLVGPALYEVYRRTKQLFDPHGLLNPGKVVDAPPMTEHLRLGPDYHTLEVLTEQDFSAEGGFARAVELCNGNGACRKLEGGTMCPSFMVLRDEEHTTRGRANALRMALSGALPPETLTGRRMYEVMDLCIQCKACKTECPSNVDMAKLKTEWLARYWQDNPVPARTRLFARLPEVAARVHGPVARLVNWVNRRGLTRRLLDTTLGISRHRTLPSFAPEPFTVWFARQRWRADGPPVVLFPDTFHNHQHPEVARAAARLLDRLGYRVVVPGARVCCGRTYLSKGFVTEAARRALGVVEALYPYVAEGMPVVGLEPSCILTLADEFRTLLPGDPRTRRVADAACTLEVFLAREAERGALDHVAWTEAPRRVLLHGHCHQKALDGTGPSERCLALPPNYTVEVLDAGCCGMAGAFGYEKEHRAVSLAMAERVLAPAVRAAGEETLIVAAGTSCRAQIHDVAGRTALHPAQVLLDALATRA
ncbi:MAG: oxidoreductase [Rhodothermaceae bacterium]|nr:MAG: oxidoreductase [Rhodothermaceae bacterium]